VCFDWAQGETPFEAMPYLCTRLTDGWCFRCRSALVLVAAVQEDAALKALVGRLGTKWAAISREMARHGAGRVGKQCRERWHHQLNPGLVKGKWTPDEVR
jgi:hypothetical protein